ncbi:MAG: class I SAM-dependent methyltransferase, partial [bacterium]
YCSGYLYQGWEELGLCGIKPTDTRLRGYGIEELLQPGDRVLDLGANNGFLALALARRVAQVDAVEINPFLVDIGRAAARHLGPHKVRFILADIEAWSPLTLYDAVLSLANHSTIDQRMSMDFETYVAKLFSLLRPGGWLFFESHNVFGPGTGGPGDDGDLDRKFDIMERYFELGDASMHRSFVPAHDIDKLFVRLRRRAAYAPDVQRSFSLAHARTLYAD